jgi:hypothetical protein
MLYLVASLAGVALLVALNIALLGRSESMIDCDQLAERLASEWPGFRMGATVRSKDGTGALMENETDGSVHLVIMRGDSLITRQLKPSSIHLARHDAWLTLKLGDFTLPQATLELPDAMIAETWERRLAHA